MTPCLMTVVHKGEMLSEHVKTGFSVHAECTCQSQNLEFTMSVRVRSIMQVTCKAAI